MKQQKSAAVLSFGCLVGLTLLSSSAQATHPSTIVDAATLEGLQAAQSQPAYAGLWSVLSKGLQAQTGKVLTSTADSDPRIVANMLAAYALGAAIVNTSDARTLATSSLMAALSWSDWGFGEGDDLNRAHMLIAASIAYDVLFPFLTSSEQAQVRQRLGSEAQLFSSDIQNGIWWSTDYLQNHNWIDTAALGLAGYTLQGEDARAQTWIAQALANSAKLKEALDLVSDGSWHEGVGYQEYGWAMAMPYWIAAARQGVDVADTAMLRSYGQYRLGVQLPDHARTYIATHGDWSGWALGGSAQVLHFAAAKYRDPAAQEAANRWDADGSRSWSATELLPLALEILVLDPTVPGLGATPVPLDFYAADQQLAVLRSDWSPSGLVLGLKSGVFGGAGTFQRLQQNGAPGGDVNFAHDHTDDGGLWLYGNGQWLLPECVGYGEGHPANGPGAWQTVYHNSFLIDGQGQLGDVRDHGDSGKSYPWFFSRYADLPLFAQTDDYAFARSDLSHLYPATSDVNTLTRTVGLARDGYVVLQDVANLKAVHQIDQVFHFISSASVQGGWVRGNSNNDQVLGVRVISPAAFDTTLSTQTASKLSKDFDPAGQEAMVQLHPATPATTATFLELLLPTTGAQWTQVPEVEPIDAAHPELGLSLPVGTSTERWIYGATTAGDLVLTGELGVVRLAPDGTPLRVVLVGAGTLSDQHGARMLLSSSNVGVVEVSFEGNQAIISGTPSTGVSFYGQSVTTVTMGSGAGGSSDGVDAGPGEADASVGDSGSDAATGGAQTISWHRTGSAIVIDSVAPPAMQGTPGPATGNASPALNVHAGCLCSQVDWSGVLGLAACCWRLRRRRSP